MDAEGVVFRGLRQAPADLPRVQTGADTGSEALREGALVVAALPGDLAAQVDHVEVATVDEISLVLRDGREVRLGERGASPTQKADGPRRPARASRRQQYDVSVPGQPTTSA